LGDRPTHRTSPRGRDLWNALEGGAVGRLGAEVEGRAAQELDRLGDVLAAWAVDRSGTSPDAEVDRVVDDVAQRLGALGVPQQATAGPRNRG
jgi:hypothetical protein